MVPCALQISVKWPILSRRMPVPTKHQSVFSPIIESSPVSNRPVGRMHLGIGAVYIGLEPTTVWTVLGSCLAVIMYAPVLRVSAICHAQLPRPGGREAHCRQDCPHPCRTDGTSPNQLKYVTCCIDYMMRSLAKRGVVNAMIACALVGGADVLQTISAANSVGRTNIQSAREVLAAHRLPIHFEDVGGSHGRTLTYQTSTGNILLRETRPTKD